MKFDVSTDPWICVIREDGTPDELNLLEVLAQAHQIRALVDPMPTVEFGLHRLLVAFVLDIFQPKKMVHWRKLWEAGAFDRARLETYFADNADCFNLFDVEKPFLQTAKVVSPKPEQPPKTTKKSKQKSINKDEDVRKPLAVLLPSIPTGVNAFHFHHQYEKDFGVCAAVAARLLTAVGPFAINIGPGPGGNEYHMPDSINRTRQVFVLPTGKNLWETLLFNTPVLPQALKTNWGEEIPAWRDASPTRFAFKEAVGLVEGLTFRPRQVRLLVGEQGICNLTGTQGPMVKQVLWAQGFLSKERPNDADKKAKKQPRVLQWHDPNLAYFVVNDARNIVTAEGGKELWRDTAPLLFLQDSNGPKTRRSPDGRVQMALFERPFLVDQWANLQSNTSPPIKEFSCNLYYLANDKGKPAKVEQWQRQQLSLGAPLLWKAQLHNEAQRAMEEAETVFYCLKWAIKKAHRQFAETNADTTIDKIAEKVKAGEPLPSSTDKKNPSRYYAYLRRIEDAGSMFWRELRPYYDQLLDFLAEDHEDGAHEKERQNWLDQVRKIGWKTLELALDDLDGTAEGLERQTRAYKTFRRAIFTTVDPVKAQAQRSDANSKSNAPNPSANGQLSLPNI